MSDPKVNNRLGIELDGEKPSFTAGSLLKTLGGWWGIVESIIPTVAYVLLFAITKKVLPAAIVSGGVAVLFIIRQLVLKKPLGSALAGAASMAIAVFLPLREGGRASDYFTVGLLTNLGYFAAMVISILVRFPIIGLLVSALSSTGLAWRKDRTKLRRFDAATLLWVILFGSRLLVEAPLYFANKLEILGVVKIVMGVPYYAIVAWLTWLVVRPTFSKRG